MQKLRDMRIQKHMLSKDVAEHLKISRITLWKYETGKQKPKLDILIKFAELYGCTVNDFV